MNYGLNNRIIFVILIPLRLWFRMTQCKKRNLVEKINGLMFHSYPNTAFGLDVNKTVKLQVFCFGRKSLRVRVCVCVCACVCEREREERERECVCVQVYECMCKYVSVGVCLRERDRVFVYACVCVQV